MQSAHGVPNVSGGRVPSAIEQRADWNYDYNAKLGSVGAPDLASA